MITFILIYLIGSIITFFLLRHVRRRENEFSKDDPWEGIWFNLWFPITSWIGAIISTFFIIKSYVEEHDPPEWL